MAEACLEIKSDRANAARYTSRSNLAAVISNGSAVLGLGNIGALASKPEGKAFLFRKFASIDCFDIEVDEDDPEKLANIEGRRGRFPWAASGRSLSLGRDEGIAKPSSTTTLTA